MIVLQTDLYRNRCLKDGPVLMGTRSTCVKMKDSIRVPIENTITMYSMMQDYWLYILTLLLVTIASRSFVEYAINFTKYHSTTIAKSIPTRWLTLNRRFLITIDELLVPRCSLKAVTNLSWKRMTRWGYQPIQVQTYTYQVHYVYRLVAKDSQRSEPVSLFRAPLLIFFSSINSSHLSSWITRKPAISRSPNKFQSPTPSFHMTFRWGTFPL